MDVLPATLTADDIAQMIDVSAVRADTSDQKILDLIKRARQYHCYLITILPSQTRLVKSIVGEDQTLKLGGNVGFPSGGQTTAIKVKEALELVEIGVDEIDVVIDIGAHLSGRYDDVYHDIASIVEVADGRNVKVILECHYLNEDQIRIGCDLAIKAGANFVKTGTGWAPTGATLENIALIKGHVGDAIAIKASGGIRGLETLMEMYRRGATRFGISVHHASRVLESVAKIQRPISLR